MATIKREMRVYLKLIRFCQRDVKEAQKETFKSCWREALWFLERLVLPRGYAAGKKCSVATEKTIHGH